VVAHAKYLLRLWLNPIHKIGRFNPGWLALIIPLLPAGLVAYFKSVEVGVSVALAILLIFALVALYRASPPPSARLSLGPSAQMDCAGPPFDLAHENKPIKCLFYSVTVGSRYGADIPDCGCYVIRVERLDGNDWVGHPEFHAPLWLRWGQEPEEVKTVTVDGDVPRGLGLLRSVESY
jgi:hypothetical protein